MTQTDTKMEHQIFCLPSNKLYYGLELDSIIETVQNVQITPIPCLPEYYCGVCNHKGTVVPVLSLDRLAGSSRTEHHEHTVVVMIQCGEYECGILTGEQPVLMDVTGAVPLQEESGGLSDRMTIRKACVTQKGVVLILDVQATLEGLIVCA